MEAAIMRIAKLRMTGNQSTTARFTANFSV